MMYFIFPPGARGDFLGNILQHQCTFSGIRIEMVDGYQKIHIEQTLLENLDGLKCAPQSNIIRVQLTDAYDYVASSVLSVVKNGVAFSNQTLFANATQSEEHFYSFFKTYATTLILQDRTLTRRLAQLSIYPIEIKLSEIMSDELFIPALDRIVNRPLGLSTECKAAVVKNIRDNNVFLSDIQTQFCSYQQVVCDLQQEYFS